MASFNSLEARNATFLEALILIASPVAGLRPMRGPRLRTTRMPRPLRRMRAPFFRCLVIRPMVSSSIALALFWESSCFSASWLARLRVEMVSTFAAALVAMGLSLLANQRYAQFYGIFGVAKGHDSKKAPKNRSFLHFLSSKL